MSSRFFLASEVAKHFPAFLCGRQSLAVHGAVILFAHRFVRVLRRFRQQVAQLVHGAALVCHAGPQPVHNTPSACKVGPNPVGSFACDIIRPLSKFNRENSAER